MTVKLWSNGSVVNIKQWTFPGGERGVSLPHVPNYNLIVECNFRDSNDLMDILLLANACRNIQPSASIRLRIPYFPYARQDRVTAPGEAHALQVVASVIQLGNWDEIEVWDIHSSVLEALVPPGRLRNIPQHKLLKQLVLNNIEGTTALVAPDNGALKKIYPLADMLNLPVLEANKIRDPKSGRISKSSLDLTNISAYNSLIVVDDICDGGATFIQLGEHIRSVYEGRLVLLTTHGIYSKGIEVLWEHYDVVSCVNDIRS